MQDLGNPNHIQTHMNMIPDYPGKVKEIGGFRTVIRNIISILKLRQEKKSNGILEGCLALSEFQRI